jgi:hypothetical protein
MDLFSVGHNIFRRDAKTYEISTSSETATR